MLIDIKTPWSTHIPSDGSHIADGAPDPTSYGVTQGPAFHPEATLFSTEGAPWAAWETYKLTPLAAIGIPPSGRFGLQLSFDLMAADANAHVYETDTIFCSADGYNSNLSVQRNMGLNGMMQIAGPNGDWVNTGIMAPKLTLNEWHPHTFQYALDLNNHTCVTHALVIDGQLFMVPTELQAIAAAKKGWKPGVLFQAQTALKSGGGRSAFMLRNIRYEVR